MQLNKAQMASEEARKCKSGGETFSTRVNSGERFCATTRISKSFEVKIPCSVFPVATTTELTRNSRIFCVATYTGSEGETIATLKINRK
jgi:hypothetical protein